MPLRAEFKSHKYEILRVIKATRIISLWKTVALFITPIDRSYQHTTLCLLAEEAHDVTLAWLTGPLLAFY